MTRLLDTELVQYSAEVTKDKTNSYLAGVAEYYPKANDVLFKLPYFTGELEPVETDIGGFQSFCSMSYSQIPYTLLTIFELYQRAYYLEATILYRHMLEVFVQLKYFHKYPEKLEAHLTDRQWVKFKTMFVEFTSEDFYKVRYGHLLSSFSHGKIAKTIFRFKKVDGEMQTVMGCVFDEDDATYIVNQVTPLLLGYLLCFPKFFPNNTLANSEVYPEYINSIEWLQQCISDHKEAFPRSITYYNDMEPLIYP